MRSELLKSPSLLIRRIAAELDYRERRRKLSGTDLRAGELDSLELLELAGADDCRVIFDIGANVGKWTKLARRIHPRARIEAFEPLAEAASQFRKIHGSDSQVKLHQLAIGSFKGIVDVNVSEDIHSSSVLHCTELQKSTFGTKFKTKRLVEQTTLDDLCGVCKLPLPDFIKIDVQGYEREVLLGASQTLSKVMYVLVEVSFVEFYKTQPLFHEISATLWNYGFSVYAFSRVMPLGVPALQADVLFRKRS